MKRLKYILLLICCCSFVAVKATTSPFTQLDWTEMRIDSLLPTYTEVVPLETDYRLYDYSVRISFAEWLPLTDSETAVSLRYDSLLADTLRIYSHVGVSRKQAMLDIAFVPIVRRAAGRYDKLMSCKIEIVPQLKNKRHALTSRAFRHDSGRAASDTVYHGSRYADNSVLAQGQWVKISVEDDGIYHLTTAALRQMGFHTTANIRVFGYGGHRLPEVLTGDEWDDLHEVPLVAVADGYLFWADGVTDTESGSLVINNFARRASYFVTQAETPYTTPTIAATPNEVTDTQLTPTLFTAMAYYAPQEYAWFSGGRQLYENYDFINGNTRDYTLTLPSYLANNATTKSQLSVTFSAVNDVNTEVSTSFNGSTVGTLVISPLADYCSAMQTTAKYSVQPQQTNTVRLSATKGSMGRLGNLQLTYTSQARITADVPFVHFTAPDASTSPAQIIAEYADGQQPCVMRLSTPANTGGVLETTTRTQAGSDGTQHRYIVTGVDNTQDDTHRYVVFDAAATSYPEPTIDGPIDNQDLHATSAVDLVIITPASGMFDAEAQRLAEAHEAHDGLRTLVVRADKIFNEFSSGTPDATAYRRLLKMLYDRATTPEDEPRYLLLFGDCAWDNRMISTAWRNYEPDNFLLAYESENSLSDTKSFIMEDYFGLLDDGEGSLLTEDKVDIGVGRFPVRTLTEARVLVDKTISYIRGEQVGAWKNVISVLGDDGNKDDGNVHMDYADNVARLIATRSPEVEVRKIMWDSYPRVATATGYRYPGVQQALLRQIEDGALMFNYTGHAAPYCLSHEQVIRIEDFASITAPRTALWVTAACDVMPFDTHKENIGETAMLNASGLAVAFFGTTRTVYAYNNLQMNRMFSRALFATDELQRPNRLGDAVRYAKVHLISDNLEVTNRENKLHYALLGDPALRLGSIQNRVVIDSINGTPLAQLPEGFTISAGERARFSGHLEAPDGQLMDDFFGTVTGHLYDSESELTCRNNASLPEPFKYKAYDKLLYSGSDSVAAGKFSFTCPVPIEIKYTDEAGRLVCFAVSDDKATEANGYCTDFNVGGTSPDITDSTGPEITAYLDKDTFVDGDRVGATPYFVALLNDPSGINYSGNGLGHDLELVVDNNPATTYTLNEYYNGTFGDYSSGTVAFSIPTLEGGEHTLLFRAWDLLNNYSNASLRFVVDPTIKTNIISLTATNSPATTQTQFLLHYDRPGSLCRFTVEVFDFAGRLLWTHSETGSSSNGLYVINWNLTTGSGMPLHSGVYLYRARVSCDNSEEATKAQKIIINRRK